MEFHNITTAALVILILVVINIVVNRKQKGE